MLIDFKKAVRQYNMKIRGVVHVGAHWGQEYDTYKECGIPHIVFIEPCIEAYNALELSFNGCADVKLLNFACGSAAGKGTMHVESANMGMSNSLLKPALHLIQHPNIAFTSTEEVEVRTLDSLMTDFTHNLLVMDCQGFEAEVLKGASVTLPYFDYVYTEVNRAEVYEGCAQIEEIDAILSDFTRVETKWAGNWGDAIYCRKTLLK